MNRFITRLVSGTRTILAEFFVQILAFIVFCAAGLAWLYFSTPYAIIPVFIIGIAFGGYLYGLIEGKKSENSKKNQK